MLICLAYCHAAEVSPAQVQAKAHFALQKLYPTVDAPTRLLQRAVRPEQRHVPQLAAPRVLVERPQLQAVPVSTICCRHRGGGVGQQVVAVAAKTEQDAACKGQAAPAVLSCSCGGWAACLNMLYKKAHS